MNMISTGAFLNEMDASKEQLSVAEKFAAVWEKKNAKAARAGGVSLMALSLAACGGSSSTTTTTTTDTTTDTTPVTPASQSFTLTSSLNNFEGGDGADTFTAATAAVVQAFDILDGGAGTDTLAVTDVASAFEGSTGLSGTFTSVENLTASTTGGYGTVSVNASGAVAATGGTEQIAKFTVGTPTDGDAVTVTINGTTYATSITSASTTSATQAADAIEAVVDKVLGGDYYANTAGAVTITSPYEGSVLPTITGSHMTAASGSVANVDTVLAAGAQKQVLQFVLGGTGHSDSVTSLYVDGLAIGSFALDTTVGAAKRDAVATKIATELNKHLDNATAVATGATVTVTANEAGTNAEFIGISIAGSTATTVTQTEIVAGADGTVAASGAVAEASFDVTDFAGSVNLVAADNAVVTAASTADVTLSSSSGSVKLSGGNDVTVNHSSMGADDITVAAGADVTINANKATTGSVTLTKPTGNVDVNYNGTFANAADATLGSVTVSSAGASVDVDVTSGAASAALAATNYTVTQGAVDVTGGTTTTSVSVSQDAAVTAVAGTASTGKIGVVQGAVTITDGNAATASDTITSATIENFGNTTITSTVLDTLNVTADATNTSGTITIDQSASDTSTAATSLTISGSGKVGAIDGTQADVYTSVAFDADAALTVADINFALATSITASGAGVTTISASSDDDEVTSYTSTGGGLVLSATMGTAVTFTGGDGEDAITVGQTTATNTMGGGNDTVTMLDVLGTGGTIDGGAGDDILVINDVSSSGFNNPSGEPRVTGFETLKLGALANGAYNATGFTAIGHGNTAAAVSFTNVAAGVGVTYTATSGNTSDIVLSDATGTADVIDLAFTSAAAIDYTANTADITIAGVETVNITTTDSNTTAHTNKADLEATSAKTITVTGDTGFDFVINGTSVVTLFDASGISGATTDAAALGVTYDSTNNTVGAVVTIKGGSGEDTLTGAANAHDTIYGNAGDDHIDYDGGSDVLYGGSGNDTFDIDALGTETVHATIADLSAGDKLSIADIDAGTATWNATELELGASATLAQYMDGAAAANSGASNSVLRWFQYDGNTYLVNDNSNNTTFTAGTDAIIQITGLVDLADATLATTTLTIA